MKDSNKMLALIIIFSKADTEASWESDVSAINLSLFHPFSTEEKRLEVLKKINLTISDLEFESKSGPIGGSLRYTSPQVFLNINSLSFKNSRSQSSGGSVNLDTSYDIILNNCSYNNSSAVSTGGSVHASSTNSIIIQYSRFFNSSAGNNGGSIYSMSNNAVILTDSIFNTTKGQNGGSAYVNTAKCNISKTWFENSEATNGGGSLFIQGLSSNQFYEVLDCFFGECKSSQNGGAVHIYSSSYSITKIYDCTFYSCSTNGGHGGALYIATQSNSIGCDLQKICFSQCMINSTSSAYYGTALYVSSSTQDYLLSFDQLTFSNCGVLSVSQRTVFLYNGQQLAQCLNFSKCDSQEMSGFYLYPYFSSTYMFFNIVNCSSTTSCVVYIYYQSGQIDVSKMNTIYNSCNSAVIRERGSTNMIIIKFSVFYGNIGTLFIIDSQYQMLRNCYIVHSGTLHSGFNFDLCVTTLSTSVLTPTHIITHYSTYMCQTPYELGVLEVPCQTMPEGIYSVECPTNPPIPTTCDIHTADAAFNIVSISSIIRLMISSLINIF